MIDPGLTNKVVAVTGTNNPYGIGAAIVRAFAAQGSKIFLHYFPVHYKGIKPEDAEGREPGEVFYHAQNTKGVNEVLSSIAEFGAESSAWEVDLSDVDAIPKLFDEAEKSLGPVEIIVNNAAAWTADTFVPPGHDLPNRTVEEWTDRPEQITPESFEKNFAVNTRAVALLMAEFANRHISAGRTWGRIINVSTDGAHCFPSEISYGAGKLAIEGYSRSAAVELGQFGITVNIISPGPIQTGWITPAIEQEDVASTPLGRIGQPEDIADVAVFLASEQARWVTGQLIHVGGGHRM
jgi:3-oxoacyl-[acyl-carrier protein] reductase